MDQFCEDFFAANPKPVRAVRKGEVQNMSIIGEGIETVVGDYKIRIVQLEIDRHIAVLHTPSGRFLFHDYVPAGFPPLPGASASEEKCKKYAVEVARSHARSSGNQLAIDADIKWERGSFPIPAVIAAQAG